MSQENIEIVKAFFDAWNAADMVALREMQDPDVIQRPPAGWPEPGPFVGREANMRQFEQLRDTWVSDTVKPISAFIDIADHVLVRYRWRATGEGPESNIELTALYTVRRGKIIYQEFFWDHAEALEAVGLAE